MKYADLRDFLRGLEGVGELKRVSQPVSTRLEIIALANRVLRTGGPALLLECPIQGGRRYKHPVLANLLPESMAAIAEIGAFIRQVSAPAAVAEPSRTRSRAGRRSRRASGRASVSADVA